MNLPDRFHALTTLLHAHEPLWKPAPFCFPVLPWESQHPALSQQLRSLDDNNVRQLESDQAALIAWLEPHLPELVHITALTEVAALHATPHSYPDRFEHDIPGRKWQQVTAFAGCIDALDSPVLEWCAGKAHLGRAIHHRFRQAVTSLEWNKALCEDGEHLGQQHHCDVHLQHCDVMSPAADTFVQQHQHAIALHACGDLHRRLLQLTAQHGNTLHLSPCCYHLTSNDRYLPLSQTAQRSGLSLQRDDLRLAVQETVTAPGSVARLRELKSAYRLGFDLLQRQLRQQDHYLPVPSMADADFQQGFRHFCRVAADLKRLPLPEQVDWEHWEALGEQRHAEVSRLELPRHAFRRALELWLVLDYALFLEENGYRIRLGTFCDRSLTPRNLLLTATRQGTDLSQ